MRKHLFAKVWEAISIMWYLGYWSGYCYHHWGEGIRREKVLDLRGRQVGIGLGGGQDRNCDLRTEQVMDSLRQPVREGAEGIQGGQK